ncbi:glycoside hydrolase family 99-like domain-containing protein [Paraburkholderia caffeinilytica]
MRSLSSTLGGPLRGIWSLLSIRLIARNLPMMGLALLVSAHASADPDSYNVGVYYFPGWSPGAGKGNSDPWSPIKRFPERKPLLGWYDDSNQKVIAKQLEWMKDYGINFVTFDWYWEGGSKPVAGAPISNYLHARDNHGIKFNILWANHAVFPRSLEEFDVMVDYWISNYFSSPNYLKIDDRPVVMVFSATELERSAQILHIDSALLLQMASRRAIERGLRGIYFVASTLPEKGRISNALPKAGYDALTAYNYHAGIHGMQYGRRLSHSYSELTGAYAENWNYIIEESELPYLVPVTAGWDKAPWGGSEDPAHDNSEGSSEEFRQHLLEARDVMTKNPERTKRTVIICCWNEFGEGSFIEPTKARGFSYLGAVRDVFGNK